MALQKDELVAKLKDIFTLYEKTESIRAEMDEFEPEDIYERKVAVPKFPGKFKSEEEREVWQNELDHTDEDAAEIIEQTHRKFYAPTEPKKPVRKEFNKCEDQALAEKQKKLGCFSSIAIGIAIFFLLGAIFGVDDSTADTLPTILGIAAIAGVACVLFKFKQKATKAESDKKLAEAEAAHNCQQDAIMADYEEKLKVYKGERETYEQGLQQFMDDYCAWREVYLQSVAEEEEIEEKLEADRTAAVNKIYEEEYLPAEAALNQCNDLVAEDYLPVLDVIIDLLKSNRADDLKEAINLYEELVYRERQLQLQREQEEQRRYEEELRRENEERRHREEMAFLQEQERQRQREEEQRRNDEERRHREDMRAREAEERSRQLAEKERIRKEEYRAHMDRIEEERKQWNAAKAQCRACAHAAKCSMSIHNKTPNCTGFTPR